MPHRLGKLAASPYALAVPAALILMLFAFVNGYAVLFDDSRSYIRGSALALQYATGVDLAKDWPERGGPPGSSPPAVATEPPPAVRAAEPPPGGVPLNRPYSMNRSVYYGALGLFGYVLSDFWLSTFIQAYLVAVPIGLLFFRCLGLSRAAYFATIAMLAIFTSVGVFSALLMPDILAPALILGAALLFVYGPALAAADTAFLFATMAFAALSHATHLALLVAAVGWMAATMLLVPAFRDRWRVPVVCLAALLVGVAGYAAFNKALEHATGHKTIVLPHLTASLIWKGPGYAYLLANCPQVDLVICNALPSLPQYPEAFIGADPKHGVFASADLATQIRMSDEQSRFALAVVKSDPAGVALAMLRGGIQQALDFPVVSLKVSDEGRKVYAEIFPPDIFAKFTASTLAVHPVVMDVVSALNYAATFVSLATLAYLALTPGGVPADRRRGLWTFNLTVVFLVLCNAVICGGINVPVDRYQSRVVWLLPLLAAAGVASRLALRRAAERPAIVAAGALQRG